MLSQRGWARFCAGVMVMAVLGIVGCEEDDAAFAPLVDDDPPSVSINEVNSSESEIEVIATAEDFIAVASLVVEIRDPNQQVTEINADGDTLVLGRLLAVDTSRFVGRVTSTNVTVTFTNPFAQATIIDVRAVARDAQDNEGVAIATVIVGGGGTGGLGTPAVAITSPLPNSTVRDNTLIRVGISATDQIGLAQLNVVMTGVTTQPRADTIRFATFRSQVDTLLDFFIPAGNLGTLTITAEAINLNSISAFASINVTVAQVVSGDTIPPTVSMVVSGGVQRRLGEAPRMELDDSVIVDIVATDDQTAVTRIGVTYVISNATTAGTVIDTIFQDSVLSPAVSGTAPIRFALVPNTLPVSIFDPNNLPDTLFFEITGWAFDAAATPNCGATVDLLGAPNRLDCVGTGPVLAAGLSGGFTDRLIVQGQTVSFPQGALIADAVVDTLRETMLLSDFNFGLVRPFDLRAQTFLGNVPVGSEPWGMAIDNTQDGLLVGNSGGTNISLVSLGARTNPPAIVGEVDRFQTQDLKVFVVEEEFDPFGAPIYPVVFFDYSDRPQFIAQAANGLILFSTRPAIADAPGTIREFDPGQREIRFFIDYADREAPSNPQIQVVNADSVKGVAGNTLFKICDHQRGNPANRSCVFVPDDGDPLTSAFEEAENDVAAQVAGNGWDALVLTDLVVESIGLQDTTFVTASGDREFIAFGEGDTPGRAGRIIMYQSATQTITNSLQVNDLTENAAQQVFGLALDNDGLLGVGRGEVAFFFGPDQPGGPNVLRLLGTNNDIQTTGTGAALHPDHDQFSVTVDNERLAFLGSGDGRIEIVDTHFFDFKRGDLIIRDPIVGPLRITRGLSGLDPANVVVRLYGVTANGVVVIKVLDTDIDPIP